MQRPRSRVLAFAFAGLVLVATGAAQAIEKVAPDPKAVELVGQLITALRTPDETARAAAVKPLVHRTLLDPAGADLSADVKRFQFKKASVGAHNYKLPIEIYEVHKGNPVTIGFRETAQKGRRDKYFIQPTDSKFRPAPIIVFVPEDGSGLYIENMGSLN